MDLQHPYILILHLLSEDMLVSENLPCLFFSHMLDAINLLLSLFVDVFVHRLLAASLGIYKLPTVFQDRPQLTSVADSKGLLFSSIFNCSDKICKLASILIHWTCFRFELSA